MEGYNETRQNYVLKINISFGYLAPLAIEPQSAHLSSGFGIVARICQGNLIITINC